MNLSEFSPFSRTENFEERKEEEKSKEWIEIPLVKTTLG